MKMRTDHLRASVIVPCLAILLGLCSGETPLITLTGAYDSVSGQYIFSKAALGLGSLNFQLPFKLDLYNPYLTVPSTWCSACTYGLRFNPNLSSTNENFSTPLVNYKQPDLYSSTSSSLQVTGYFGNDTVTLAGKYCLPEYLFLLAVTASQSALTTYLSQGAWLGLGIPGTIQSLQQNMLKYLAVMNLT